MRGKVLTNAQQSIKSVNIFPCQKIALYSNCEHVKGFSNATPDLITQRFMDIAISWYAYQMISMFLEFWSENGQWPTSILNSLNLKFKKG